MARNVIVCWTPVSSTAIVVAGENAARSSRCAVSSR
jgi:hypothetical protein